MGQILRLLASDILVLLNALVFVGVLGLVGVDLSPWVAIVLAFLAQLVCVAIDQFGRPGGGALTHRLQKILDERRKE